MLNLPQQFYELSAKSERPLIALRPNFTGDALASALALAKAYKKFGKEPTLAAENYTTPAMFSFLPGAQEVRQNLADNKTSLISFDLSGNNEARLTHEIRDGRLHLSLHGLRDDLTLEKITMHGARYAHDLIITLNAPDLPSLGALYDEQPDFFYQAPIINIDHAPENERFGHINLVELTAASIAEMIFHLLEQTAAPALDEEIATCLLAGLIDKTHGFRAPNITPRVLEIASRLMAAGADKETIIKNLFQSKSVGTLKLWGKVLQSLNHNNEQTLIWSRVSAADFPETGALPADLPGVVEELIAMVPTVKNTAIFYEYAGVSYCLIKTETKHDLRAIFQTHSPRGRQNEISFVLTSSAETILDYLKQLS